MITFKVEKINEGTLEGVQQPIRINQRLDRELDSGDFNYTKHDPLCRDCIDAPLTPFRIELSDEDTNDDNPPLTVDFVGTDTRTLLRGKFGDGKTTDTAPLFRHCVMLTEPTKLLEGTLIDGFAVTQPEEDENTESELTTERITFSGFDREETRNGIKYGYKEIKLAHSIKSVRVSIVQVGSEISYSGVEFNVGDDHFYIVIGYTSRPGYIELEYIYERLYKSQSLEEVVDRLLAVTSLRKRNQSQVFKFNPESKVKSLLTNTLAPQFKWSPQTTVWECLCDVGSVIDAIPRLKADDAGKFVYVDFDLVNDTAGDTGKLLDKYAIDYAEEVDDSQYNTQLRSVVENIKEE